MSYIEENGYFVFDGVKSSDYGVWINGSGAYDAPKRRYNEYVVPGRNGTLTIDEGAFEELEVKYPAFISEDFPENVEAFRNELMARNGYVRMTESYHPNEYYLAKYMNGLEANVYPLARAGRFDLVFRRDPRRFLKSGDSYVKITSGGNITNPTLFSSKPIIKVTPYRAGENLITYPFRDTTKTTFGITFTDNGDGTVTASGTATYDAYFHMAPYGTKLPTGNYTVKGGSKYVTVQISVQSSDNPSLWVLKAWSDSKSGMNFEITEEESRRDVSFAIRVQSGATISNVVVEPELIASVDDGRAITIGAEQITIGDVYPYVLIDSELQTCYQGMNNLNSQVLLQSNEFPELKPGKNDVTFSSNIKDVEIMPRWFIV